jgi:uncharacterized protein involved in outer membrane biogenesis
MGRKNGNDTTPVPTGGYRRLASRLAIAVAVLVVGLIACAIVGIPVPLGPFKNTIEFRSSDALGREVRIGGLALVLGVNPRLQIEDLHVGHLLADRPPVLRAERIELKLALAPLIRRRLHIVRAMADGVTVRIDPEAFPVGEPETAPASEPGSAALSAADWSMDVEELAVSNFDFEQHRPAVDPVKASLERLAGTLLWDESLELAFSGRFRDYPVSARIEGASLAGLVEGAEKWPLRLALELAGSPIEFAAQVATDSDVYRIEDIQGRAGKTSVSGWLAFESFATRPRASGRIEVGAVDLVLPERGAPRVSPPGTSSAWLDAVQPAAAAPARANDEAGEPEGEAGPSPIALFMDVLRDYELDLELEVARIAGIGPTVKDLAVALRVSGGELRFPVSLTADEIPMSGTLRVDRAGDLPRLNFQLAAEQFRVDELASKLLPEARIVGPFEELRLELEGRGDSLLGFLETLRIDLRMSEAALTYGVERPVPFRVETLQLTLEESGPITLEAGGNLLGEAVAIDLSGGTMQTLLSGLPWDLHLAMSGAGATLELSGQATGRLAELDLLGSLWVRGDRLSRLEPWIGSLPVPDAAYSIRARIDDRPGSSRIDLEEVRLGETNLVGELGERRGEGESLLWANLRIETLDVSPYVEAVRRARAPEDAPTAEEGGIAFDAPILPGGLSIRDADFDLGVGRLVAGDLELADLRFAGAFRDGFLPRSEFGFQLGSAGFEGTITADLREAPHDAAFEFATRDVDVGQLLSRLGVAEGVESRASALRIQVRGEGATLGDVLERSDFKARLEDVRWTLRDPHSQADVTIVLDRGELSSPEGDEPIRLVAEGSLKGVPVRLSMQTERLSFFSRPEESVPLDLRLELAGATLDVESRVSLPIERSELDLSLSLAGRSLESASPLFEYELPPIGPYRLTSRLHFTPRDYRFSDFDLRIGQSRLQGSGRLDLRGTRPRIELELASDRIQVDDFAAAFETSAGDETESDERAPSSTEASRYEKLDQVREFWSPDGLLGFDGRLVARASQVLSGADELGRGELVAKLENGRLALDPLHLELPGGPFDLRTDYAYVARGTAQGVEARIRAHTDRFDYGPLARRVDPETEMEGWISLDLDVAGTAPETRALLAHANGTLDFLAAPENIDTDVFDLWAVSLLRFIVPRLDPGPRSTLNCLVARFDLADGIMDEKALLLDTTGMVVRGDARVDFRDERFRALLTPAPKKAEFLSLQTRVEVKGGFNEFGIGVSTEEILATVVRFATSVVVAPLRRIFEEPLPEDGEETCLAAWQQGRE